MKTSLTHFPADPETALKDLSTLIPFLESSMSPTSHPLLALHRLYALLLLPHTTAQARLSASQVLSRALDGAKVVYPIGHPVLAVISAELAKTLAVDVPDDKDRYGMLAGAVREMDRTVRLCREGFGLGGGLLGREMAEYREGCMAELRYLQDLREGPKRRS